MRTPGSHMRLPTGLVLAVVASLVGANASAAGQDAAAAPLPETAGLPGAALHHIRSIPCVQPETGLRFSPLGVAFDLKGDLYVVDADNSRLLVAEDSSADFRFFAGCPREAQGCTFVDIAAEGGIFYVSDRSGGSLLTLNSKGDAVLAAEVGAGIGGIGFSRSGAVYAATTVSGAIAIVDVYGKKSIITCPIAPDRGGSYPVDCLVRDSGKVLVTDAFARQVLVLGSLGDREGSLKGFDFVSPFGLCAWEDRLIFVSDSEKGCVAVFDGAGRFVGTFGEGRLETPTFLAARYDGTVCVADPGKMTIEVFRLDDLTGE